MIGLTGCAGAVSTIRQFAIPQVVVPATPPPRAERPVYQLGERWIRTDGVYELVRIHEDRYVFRSGRDREVELSKDLVPLGWSPEAPDWMSPPPPLVWPLEVGQ